MAFSLGLEASRNIIDEFMLRKRDQKLKALSRILHIIIISSTIYKYVPSAAC
jgi:hypothetical protein